MVRLLGTTDNWKKSPESDAFASVVVLRPEQTALDATELYA
jgi:hypothetical protein